MSANPNRKIRRPPAWNCGCKGSEFLGDMQIKITLEVIFIVEGVKSMVYRGGELRKAQFKV